MNLPVYLDYCATTPCDPAVVEAMLPFFSRQFGNAASRTHSFGWQAEEAVKLGREQVASLIGAEPGEIVFTSGATESVNLAIKGVFETYQNKGNHIITCNIEHRAVLDTCRHLEKQGAELSYLNVDEDGLIDLKELEAAIRPSTVLIAIMTANNEIGTIMPTREISALARSKGIFFLTDATQAVGKIPVNVQDDGIDLMAFNAHKIYGPKGIGALFVRRRDPRVKLSAQIHGGGHEKGMRSGTLNVPGIVGFGKACEICMNVMAREMPAIRLLRDRLERAILEIEGTGLNGSKENRLPNLSNTSFSHSDSESIMTALAKDLAVSSGSACMSLHLEPSYVLKALGLNDATAASSIRFSLGRFTTEEEIDYVIEKITRLAMSWREQAQKIEQ